MEGPTCDACGARRALVRWTSSSGTRLLCDDCCAGKSASDVRTPIDLERFFFLLARPATGSGPVPFEGMPAGARCPVCATTYADLERTGLLGCASCYDAFAPAVTQALWTLQGVAVGDDRDR